MQEKIIVDTGPLVSYLNRNDRCHEWTLKLFAQLYPPFYTCESVISEACFLLMHHKQGTANLLALVERGLVRLSFNAEEEMTAVKMMLNKYQNIPMSFADACLVRMSEQISHSVIVTLDSDFKIYRKFKRNMIPTLMPDNI